VSYHLTNRFYLNSKNTIFRTSPCIFVWDCSAAGNILSNFNRWAERRDADASTAGGQQRQQSGSPDDPNSPSEGTYTPFLDCIHLAACEADQTLPMSPELPADLFTCCLTSPIEIALRFFVLQDPLRVNVDPSDPKAKITVDLVMKIPGDLKDRRTPLGELNWIFTAVTDTIAWLVFPHDIFKRLFRQDLLVAALFRNYLLAERIMRAYNCTPMSYPALPATHNHPLWNSWDLAVDACLNQLPALLEAEAKSKENPTAPPIYEYQPSRFFTEHLTAFEVWLQHDGSVSSHLSLKPKTPHLARKPPDQLPIVLQVLLSQAHRLRALILLSKFVDLGPWAVRLALSIGIFPYVQKLLQSPAVDLKPVLIFIWGRILAHDRSCQTDLLKDNGFGYFAKVLAPPSPQTAPLLIPNASEHRAMCAFILSMVCRGFKQGQMACMNLDVFGSCFIRLGEDDWLLKQWSALCIAQMWADGNDEAKMLAISEHYQDQLIFMLKDNAAEVRAAAMYAIGTFLGATGMPAGTGLNGSTTSGGGGTGAQIGMTERNQLKLEAGVAQACVLQAKEDASPLVRKELVVVLSCVAREWRGWFVAAAWTYHELEERKARRDMGDETDADDGEDLVSQAVREWGLRVKDQMDDPAFAEEEHQQNLVMLFIFKLMYSTLLDLSADPHPEVASLACTVTDYLTALLLDSAFTRATGSTLRVKKYEERTSRSGQSGAAIRPTLSTPALSNVGPTDPSESQTLTKPETPPSTTSKMTATLKRNSSIATALKSLASMTGYAAPPPEPETPPVQDAPPKLSRNNTPSNLHVQPYIPPYPMARTDTDADSSTSRGSSKVSRSASVASMVQSHMRSEFGFTSMHGDLGKPRKFSAAQVIQALTDEDMERLNIRRTSRTEAGGGADGKSANGGMPQAHELGLGMVAKEVKDDVLPLRSDFYDWTMQYFKQPQMRVPDTQEPGSKEYNEQSWRQQRNHGIVETSRTSDGLASHSPWTKDLGRLPNDSWPSIVQFHSFEPQLAVADDSDNVCIWDWKTKQRLSKFSLANGYGSSISSMHFINEASSSLLLTALTDGNIRIYHEYDSADVKLVSAFHGLAEKHPVSRRSGVVSSWERRTGQLLVGGDSKFIRIWDADDESLLADFPTQAGSNVTALASDQFGGDMFVAGFGDGVVRLFDKRMAEANGVVKVLRQHHTWIKTVGVVQGDGRDLISAR
jgi:regulator-associated protein of mTOR